MEDTPWLASLLKRMNENQLALGAAIEELSNWVEQRGSKEVAQNIRGALDTLDGNAGVSPLRSLTGGRRSNEEVTTKPDGNKSATILCCFTLRGYLEKVARRKRRVCPHVCLTEAPPNTPNKYGHITAQFKRRRGTRYE
ncbi:hypothetical protein QF045_000764 [Pseudomonas sp. W4I3]|nr:hypothetical protein [Pseudomonas sp. W4I3]